MQAAGRTARGILSNWVALFFSVSVTFFVSPLVVHHLGNAAYGVWTIVLSMTSYMALLDLGLRGAVIRFVSQGHTRQDHEASSEAVSAALWLRQWIGGAVILLSFALSFLVNRLFNIPPELQLAARTALLITGVNMALSLVFGVFGGVLGALHRFDILSGTGMVQTALRAIGVVVLLRSGYGFVALAVWELTVNVLGGSNLLRAAFRNYPELKIRFTSPQRKILKEFWTYSSSIFLIHIFGQIIAYTDNIVVGAFLSVTAVTFFSIGGSLSEYVRQMVASVTTTFMPLASRFEAAKQENHLRTLLVYGTRLSILALLPIQVALFFRGSTFIRLWMGPQYGEISGHVLQIFLIAQIFNIANSTSVNICFGMAKHKMIARWGGCEAAANLLLSILLVRTIGMYGVAWGTVVPNLIIHLIIWPQYISRVVNIPVTYYLTQSWLRSYVCGVPFAIGCYFADRYWVPAHLVTFFAQIAAILPVYAGTVFLVYRKEIIEFIRYRRVPADSSPVPEVVADVASL